MKCLKIPCVDNAVMKKMEEDLDLINCVQRVENCYNLSSAFYPNLESRQLSLVFLKAIIKEQDNIFYPVVVEVFTSG